MELIKAVKQVFDTTAKKQNLFTLAGVTQDGKSRVLFVPTQAKVDVKITRGTASGEIECTMDEPLRPIKTEFDDSGELFRDIHFSVYYEKEIENVKLAALNVSTGDIELHQGTTALTGYIGVYQ